MRPTVDQLHHSGRYVLIDSFTIDEMSQFLARELGMASKAGQPPGKRTWQSWLVIGGMLLLGGAVGYLGGSGFASSGPQTNASSYLWQVGAGVLGLFLLPVHEFIHGLAFKRIGAPKVGYGYSLKSLMVYAYSQNFPTTMREVAFVAIMPFLVITTALLVGWAILPQYTVFWGTLILIHTGACIGDFVLINYHRKNRHRTIYTYDDVEGERKSYFFAEV